MTQTETYDIAIIGSGLGGLACGSILSQKGYRVCVLEKHWQIGGCLQDFKREGFLFNTGMHYIGSYSDGEVLNTLFRFLGIYDKIDVSKLDFDAFDIIYLKGKEYKIPQGIENFKSVLLEWFPEDDKAIDKYFNRIIKIYDSVDLLNLREVSFNDFPNKKGLDENVYDFLSSITQNEELKSVLCFSNSLYAGKKVSASMYIHSIITIFYLTSAYKLLSGGGQIANALKEIIEKNGGDVCTRQKVKELVCKDKEVEEIKIEGRESIKAKYIISNIDPQTTLNMLTGATMRKAYLNRIKNQEQTISCFSVYIGLQSKKIPFVNSNIYVYETGSIWSLEEYDEKLWPQGYMLYFDESKEHTGYAESMTLIAPMEFKEMTPWIDTEIEKRGEEYLKMKAEKTEKLLALLEKKYPNIKESIEVISTSSPLTYRDYTGVRDGAMYGVLTDSRNPFESQILPKTKVNNLLLTGQNINMHGVLGVTLSAIITCGELLGLNNLIKEIRVHKK